MLIPMDRKSILITGAASGIGKATAELFAAKGWFIGAFDINKPGLEELKRNIGAENCRIHVCDITHPESFCKEIKSFALRAGGKIDVLFNCAGILFMGKDDAISLEDKLRTIDINLKAVITGIHCALPFLRKSERPKIISMSSNSAIYGIPELAVYSASKFGVRALTEALNLEYERFGITVTDIMAPYVNTPMVTGASTQAHSIRTTGIALEANDVAKTVLKAVNGKKVHRYAHYSTFFLMLLARILPYFMIRPLVRFLTMEKPQGTPETK